MQITRVHGREILDSRGNPTVEADVWVGDDWGVPRCHRAPRPGFAKRSNCATATRDAIWGRASDAVGHVNADIATALQAMALDQRAIDRRLIELDGTPTKSRLGANAMPGRSRWPSHGGGGRRASPVV